MNGRREQRTRGVAWQMGGPPASRTPTITIAVAGATIHMRRDDDQWRRGWYATPEDAAKYATTMTKGYERDGLQLTAGPTEFAVDHDDEEDANLHRTVIEALRAAT